MEKKNITIPSKLYNDISTYCKCNNLKINDYCTQLLRKSFMVDKFGDIPFGIVEGASETSQPDKPKREQYVSPTIRITDNGNNTKQEDKQTPPVSSKPKKRRL